MLVAADALYACMLLSIAAYIQDSRFACLPVLLASPSIPWDTVIVDKPLTCSIDSLPALLALLQHGCSLQMLVTNVSNRGLDLVLLLLVIGNLVQVLMQLVMKYRGSIRR
jgi:hypothetical protein